MSADRRAAFLVAEREVRADWDAAVAAVPPDAISERVLPQGRSVKDLVAHIAAWDRWSAERIHARRTGAPLAPIPDWESFEHGPSEELHARWRDAPWDEVRAEADAACGAFWQEVEAVTEEGLFGGRGSARLVTATVSAHVAPYIAQVRDLVDRLPPHASFETARLRLRSFRPSDAEALMELFADPEVMRFIPPVPRLPRERYRRRIDERIASERRSGLGRWAVELRDRPGRLIGQCGFVLVEGKGPEIEIAYHYEKAAWGQGYGTEAAIACLARGFGALGLERVLAFCYPENIGSWRVMEKAGMQAHGMADVYGLQLRRYVAERATWRPPEP